MLLLGFTFFEGFFWDNKTLPTKVIGNLKHTGEFCPFWTSHRRLIIKFGAKKDGDIFLSFDNAIFSPSVLEPPSKALHAIETVKTMRGTSVEGWKCGVAHY